MLFVSFLAARSQSAQKSMVKILVYVYRKSDFFTAQQDMAVAASPAVHHSCV